MLYLWILTRAEPKFMNIHLNSVRFEICEFVFDVMSTLREILTRNYRNVNLQETDIIFVAENLNALL